MMAALVQSLPTPSTSTMTMLQTRPSSSDAFQNGSQGQQQYRNSQVPRNIYNTSVGGMVAGNYRGNTSAAPVAPYAFSSTPPVQNAANPLRQHPTATTTMTTTVSSSSLSHPRMETRASSAPTLPMVQPQSAGTSSRPRPPTVNTTSIPSNSNTPLASLQRTTSMDDSSTSKQQAQSRSLATLDLIPPLMQTTSYANVAKSSPDRYRRTHRRAETAGGLTSNSPQGTSAMPSGSGMATVGHLYTHPNQTSSTPTLSTHPPYRGAPSPNPQTPYEHNQNVQPRLASKDDMNVQRQSSSELAKRYRRRSISSLDAKEYALPLSEAPSQSSKPKTYAATLASPAPTDRKKNRGLAVPEPTSSAYDRRGSNESGNSGSSGAKSFSVCTLSSHMVQKMNLDA